MKARPNKPQHYKSGYYKPLNESKIVGNSTDIVFRSSLEYKFCIYVDNSDKVIKWGSEVVKVPYISYDGKQHNYIIDFYVEIKNPNNPTGYERLLIEVKPHAESMRIINNEPPKKPTVITPKSLKNWEYSIKEFAKNKQKWIYAQEYARLKGMKFLVVTDKMINSSFL